MSSNTCKALLVAVGVLVWAGIAGEALGQRQSSPSAAGSAAKGKRDWWNFVVILADDLGWADLGCYGADLHLTPRLDRFAAESVRFTQAYAAAPVCSPTRASIMTGKYPARLHMTVWYEASANPPQRRRLIPPVTVGNLPHEEVTIAEVLHQAGYTTAHVGKWHLGDAAHYPETQGFDVNIGGTFWGAPNTFFYPYRGAGTFGNEFRYVPHLEFGTPGEYLTDRLTDEAIGVLRRVARRPFFLYLAYHAVHTPIEAKAAYVERFADRLRPELHHRNPVYAAMTAIVDENVGRLLDELEKLHLAERTVVIFTSDNGGYVNNYRGRKVTDNWPLRSGKGSLWEGGVRVPLMIRWPGVTPAGAVCDEPVISCDFYPTILEIAGLPGGTEQSAAVDGISLVPLLKNPSTHLKRRELFFHYPHYYPTTTPVSSIRAGRWKLLHFWEDDHLELYDLESDLGEKHNLAAQMPDRAKQLDERLQQWLTDVDAQMPRPNPSFGK